MFIKSLFKALLVSNFFFMTGCAQQQQEQTISIDEVLDRMGKDTMLVVLDVRTTAELYGPLGKLEGVIHIPLKELSARISELDAFKEKEIAVICRFGKRSEVASNLLQQAGFNAKSVLGGMALYQNKKNRAE